jgi:hypothetical protein
VYPPGITHPLHIEHGKVLADFGHPTDAAQDIDRTVAIAYLVNNRIPRDGLPTDLGPVERTVANDGLVLQSAPDGWLETTEATNQSKAVSEDSFSELDLELIRALGKETWKGAAICDKARRPYDNPAKPALAALVRRNVLRKTGKGYQLSEDHYSLLSK